MTSALELALLVVAVAAIVILGLDLLRGPLRRRRERTYLDQLTADEEDAEVDDGPAPGGLSRRLRAAGLTLGTVPFVVLSLLFGALVFLGIVSISERALVAAVLVGLLAAYLPLAVLGEWARWRAWRFEERLSEAVDFMVSALNAGENPTQALRSAAGVARKPVQEELAEVVRRLDAGADIRRAQARMLARYDAEGVRLFAQTLTVKWLTGGDLADVLRSVAEVLRERVRITLRLRSELAGVQIAAVLVALLPYLLIPFFLVARPSWAPTLMEHPLGPPLLVAAVALQIIGFLWLRRILRAEL